MTFPLSNQWTDLEALNAAKLNARIDQQLNALYNLLSPLLADSQWINLPINSGFQALSGNPPQYRKIGNIVRLKGAVNNTGITASGAFQIATLPTGYQPTLPWFFDAPSSSAATQGEVNVNNFGAGVVEIRTNASVGAYYMLSSIQFTTD